MEQVDKLKIEYAELDEKMQELEAFSKSEEWQKLSRHQTDLMTIQHRVMGVYANILLDRISLVENEIPENAEKGQ